MGKRVTLSQLGQAIIDDLSLSPARGGRNVLRRVLKRVREEADVYLMEAGYRGASRSRYLQGLSLVETTDGGKPSIRLRVAAGFPMAMELGWAPPQGAKTEWADGLGTYDGSKKNMRPWLLGRDAWQGAKAVIPLHTIGTGGQLQERIYRAAQANVGKHAWTRATYYRHEINESTELQKTHLFRQGAEESPPDPYWLTRAFDPPQKRQRAWTNASREMDEGSKGPVITDKRARSIAWRAAQDIYARGSLGTTVHVGRSAFLSGVKDDRAEKVMRHIRSLTQTPGITREHLMRAGLPIAPGHRSSIFSRMQRELDQDGRPRKVKAMGKAFNSYVVFRTISNKNQHGWYSKGLKPVGLLSDKTFLETVEKAFAEVFG